MKSFPLFFSLILLYFSALHCSEDDVLKPKVRLIVNDHFRGEIETGTRLKIACDHLGWTAVLKDIHELENDPEQYDFSITLVPYKAALQDQTDYLTLMDPEHHFFTSDGYLTEQYASYSGCLLFGVFVR